jgi:hypothetical protein
MKLKTPAVNLSASHSVPSTLKIMHGHHAVTGPWGIDVERVKNNAGMVIVIKRCIHDVFCRRDFIVSL